MANKRITELPNATLPITTGVKFEAVQAGINVQVDADDMPGSGAAGVTSVTGTANRITSTGGATPVIDIDAAYDTAVTNAINAKVADAINDGTTTIAPSQNAVFDALALKQDADADLTAIAGLSPSNDDILQRKAGAWTNRTIAQLYADLAAFSVPKVIQFACSDEVTPITAGANKIKFRMPYAMTLTAIRASLSTTQTSGSIFTVDILEGGVSIFSTLLTIDNGETTSTTAATPAVISDSSLADNAEISVTITQIGDNTAKGLKINMLGT